MFVRGILLFVICVLRAAAVPTVILYNTAVLLRILNTTSMTAICARRSTPYRGAYSRSQFYALPLRVCLSLSPPADSIYLVQCTCTYMHQPGLFAVRSFDAEPNQVVCFSQHFFGDMASCMFYRLFVFEVRRDMLWVDPYYLWYPLGLGLVLYALSLSRFSGEILVF